MSSLASDEPPGLELRTWFDSTRDLSNEARRRTSKALETLHDELAHAKLVRMLGTDPGAGLEPRAVDVASAEDLSGAALGRLLPLIAVLVLLSGGSYAALSAFAGERESGTLETLLVQPVSARTIVAAKFTAVLVTALSTLVVNAGSILGSLALGLGGLPRPCPSFCSTLALPGRKSGVFLCLSPPRPWPPGAPILAAATSQDAIMAYCGLWRYASGKPR